MNAHAGGDPKRTPAMALLCVPSVAPTFSYRMVCLGCSAELYEKGMLVILKEMPFERQPEFCTLIYGIADGYNLYECQEAIADRHVGPPWGT